MSCSVFQDQSLVGNNEPVKRQRRWNTESLKVPEPQSSNLTPITTPKDTLQSPANKRFSRVDSSTDEDALKERVGEFLNKFHANWILLIEYI